MTIQDRIGDVTERIVKRSHDSRSRYLDRIGKAADKVGVDPSVTMATYEDVFIENPNEDAKKDEEDDLIGKGGRLYWRRYASRGREDESRAVVREDAREGCGQVEARGRNVAA